MERVLKPGPNYGPDLLTQIRIDLGQNARLVRAALVKTHPELAGKSDSVEVSLAEVSPGVQRFSTNLQTLLEIPINREHEMLSAAVTAVTGLNQLVANMQEYNAITTFEDSDTPLLFGKIAGVVAQYNPQAEERSFLRVIELTEIPELLAIGRVEVGKLIVARESSECREFRAWLSSIDHLDDKELKRLLTGVRATIASFTKSPAGKTLRLAVNTALGLIPGYGAATALAEGAIDTFLLDKLLPSSGALSFLSKSVPSVISPG
jgi:hypothetical protein